MKKEVSSPASVTTKDCGFAKHISHGRESSVLHRISFGRLYRLALGSSRQIKFFFQIMLDLPKDPMMLFSVINMRLRDIYPSLDALCDDLHVDKKEIIDRLAAAGFEYNEQQNKFW